MLLLPGAGSDDDGDLGRMSSRLSDIDQSRVDAVLAASRSNNTARTYQWAWSLWARWVASK